MLRGGSSGPVYLYAKLHVLCSLIIGMGSLGDYACYLDHALISFYAYLKTYLFSGLDFEALLTRYIEGSLFQYLNE